MPNGQVLMIDSGIGGLSIASELISLIPDLSLLYIADHEYFPYGSKDEAWLEKRLEQLVLNTMQRNPVDLLVIACNTASTVVLPWLRQHLDIPVVGVVPAIKPAGAYSKEKAIGILATEGTVKREYTDQLIQNFAADCDIIPVASSRLVEISEEKFSGKSPDPQELKAICSPFFDGGKAIVDVVVLGCTHFPFLREDLEQHVSSEIYWIDSGAAIAQRVASLIGNANMNSSPKRLFRSTASSFEDHKYPFLESLGFFIKPF